MDSREPGRGAVFPVSRLKARLRAQAITLRRAEPVEDANGRARILSFLQSLPQARED